MGECEGVRLSGRWGVVLLLAVPASSEPLPIEFVKIQPGEFLMGCLPSESPYMPDGSYEACQKRA